MIASRSSGMSRSLDWIVERRFMTAPRGIVECGLTTDPTGQGQARRAPRRAGNGGLSGCRSLKAKRFGLHLHRGKDTPDMFVERYTETLRGVGNFSAIDTRREGFVLPLLF